MELSFENNNNNNNILESSFVSSDHRYYDNFEHPQKNLRVSKALDDESDEPSAGTRIMAVFVRSQR